MRAPTSCPELPVLMLWETLIQPHRMTFCEPRITIYTKGCKGR
jgi:hypothetical protein